jgi:intracellular multiplication protein IcmT
MSDDWHWRNSMRSARFFAFDSRAAVPILLVLVHIRLWTLILAVITTVAFWMAERAGYGFEPVLRRLRCLIIGPKRPAITPSARRHMIDYGK